jgi:hypothetical protein
MAEVFVPLNRFRSVITKLTGEEDEVYVTPSGISTIVLSAQITNNTSGIENLTILVDSNRELAVPNFDDVNSTGSFISASALLELNKTFIQTETFAYITFQNNLLEDPITLTQTTFDTNTLRNVNAVIHDISNNSTLRTKKAADSYYDKDGILLIPSAQLSASIDAINYANELSQQIILNTAVTESANIDRLYQTQVTQSFNNDLTAESGSGFLIEQLFNVISENIVNPIRVEQPSIELIKNVPIPKNDALSPVVAGKLVLEEGYGLLISGSSELTVILSLLESANE